MKVRLGILLGIAMVAVACVFWWKSRSQGPLRSEPAPEERTVLEPRRIPLH